MLVSFLELYIFVSVFLLCYSSSVVVYAYILFWILNVFVGVDAQERDDAASPNVNLEGTYRIVIGNLLWKRVSKIGLICNKWYLFCN